MKLIETKTLTGTQASIEFTSIPQDGTDLVLLTTERTNNTGEIATLISFNDSTTGFTVRRILGGGSGSAESSAFTTGLFSGAQGTNTSSTIFASTTCYIPNYTASTIKGYSSDHVTEANGTTAYQVIFAGLWNSSAAITKITLTPTAGSSYVAGTTASLYKITKGSDGIVTTS